MKGFLLSLQSEFYKSRKTLGFWSAILLPLLITALVTVGFYANAAKMAPAPPVLLWAQYAGVSLGIMGTLLLPMFLVFIAYSVNNMEHKADTWKTLFTLPIARWSIYSAKYVFILMLTLLSLALFAGLTIGFGNLLSVLKPELKFDQGNINDALLQIYAKLFLSALGILSIQFLLSLIWSDFLKPMGIGFVGTITGVILGGNKWEYAYLLPYSHPLLAIMGMAGGKKSKAASGMNIEIFTKEIIVSLIVAAVVFVAGYFIVKRKSIK
jgi:hypothetical protein